ncbi:(E)-4-hydroxy-3-methylbut-2-enyl-diphosphate synthase [Plebeiibacterium sediminum]|uniref:4-hydroxy-3-methylbut-2-en-1-yl diphosphate synthase (flavodoxin) n=1 Tax=Plebeiibacterium sediminum TaxID=2992112 RepID=A0AAE3SI34_9BACT|nr:(E)-4-hydroxy-3-methylbut-2-enyl-diphosphate synthase [Plebeiobacterium sediminum]MCW3788763.1 (E)-4-hydroxy-3-methylbut-2-enyl-diphosphate synthase [Plebeiobacterium sediminum]
MSTDNYCIDIFNYKRYKTSEVNVGGVKIGGVNPIVVQSMTTTNTNDTSETIEQIKRICDAGGQIVRMTTQGRREANNLEHIRKGLTEDGYDVPLVADVHFNTNAAYIAAEFVEKVRINPGNFVDGAKRFAQIDYTDEEYVGELVQIREKLVPLLDICKKKGTALRIGTNHGSLSDRIMSKYGDTPMGMVESCMEFLRICVEEEFFTVVLSIKASNARIMVHTVRLLVQKMHDEGMNFPLHLGVTEAGEGEDGRIRSAVGIGTLLSDGIGDTIRVSLTEDPENEIPVANSIINHIAQKETHSPIKRIENVLYSPFEYKKRSSKVVNNIGGSCFPVVIGRSSDNDDAPDYVFVNSTSELQEGKSHIVDYDLWKQCENRVNVFPCIDVNKYLCTSDIQSDLIFLRLSYSQMSDEVIQKIQEAHNLVIVQDVESANSVAEQRAAFLLLQNSGIETPVVIYLNYKGVFLGDQQIAASCDAGPLFLDGFGDGLWIDSDDKTSSIVNSTAYSILQAARVRFSKPDYISCPGCGRTLFGLQKTTAMVKERTAHLKGLKIAVMGCIVNGPGEMADADYGYVGSGPGKITLYHQRQVIRKNIGEKEAVDELIKLIKEKGDWIEPEKN